MYKRSVLCASQCYFNWFNFGVPLTCLLIKDYSDQLTYLHVAIYSTRLFQLYTFLVTYHSHFQ